MAAWSYKWTLWVPVRTICLATCLLTLGELCIFLCSLAFGYRSSSPQCPNIKLVSFKGCWFRVTKDQYKLPWFSVCKISTSPFYWKPKLHYPYWSPRVDRNHKNWSIHHSELPLKLHTCQERSQWNSVHRCLYPPFHRWPINHSHSFSTTCSKSRQTTDCYS